MRKYRRVHWADEMSEVNLVRREDRDRDKQSKRDKHPTDQPALQNAFDDVSGQEDQTRALAMGKSDWNKMLIIGV